ncbi:hypothetical protein SUGI_0990830 [Cryptomeria japonica]|uniref:uncharacterized protein LOC131033229 n=1 Tax=Cryptomeria japonica TaxID=3369 RepID=UPI0024149C5F|nr:uncharacterized protein LOC131033229 [Cryptomeria japonica]GLJ46952.1 hypothetical protein SUGI_0990830 [Cryptomeria japonica]
MKNKSGSKWRVSTGFSLRRKSSKEKEAQVYPLIPQQLSFACQMARPYRPSLVLNLETIKEEDPSRTPSLQYQNRGDLDPTRTPLYFPKGKNKSHTFRFQRYAKLMWKVHARKIQVKLNYALRFFRKNRHLS